MSESGCSKFMAYLQSLHFRVHSFWRNFNCFGKDFTKAS
ncbi:hypothetical protein Patl1_37021 [Pistacia atlantica]|nr:hypothetical protein Patl1_37021 [Pistacia atlantica]